MRLRVARKLTRLMRLWATFCLIYRRRDTTMLRAGRRMRKNAARNLRRLRREGWDAKAAQVFEETDVRG